MATIPLDADSLLRKTPKNPAYPHYTEEVFAHKLRDSNRLALIRHDQADTFTSVDVIRAQLAELSSSVLCKVVQRARLTDPQAEVVVLWMAGFTYSEIGGLRGHCKQGTSRILASALKKLRRCFETASDAGISEVYEELTRGTQKARFL